MKAIPTCAAITLTYIFVSGRPTPPPGAPTMSTAIDTAPRVLGYILHPGEGDAIGSQVIKIDSSTGSMRLGVGVQSLRTGKSIALHMHEAEDEILFIHEGTGKGIVGKEQKELTPGTTLYIPQGVWHGVQNTGKGMKVLWVVSPPNFPRSLREIDSVVKLSYPVDSDENNRIALKHKQKDARYFLAEVLGRSAWDGGKGFGRVEFDTAGVTATFVQEGQINKFIVRDSSPDGLGFQGEWLKPGGGKSFFEMYYDFATGKQLAINFKEGSAQKIIWHRVDK